MENSGLKKNVQSYVINDYVCIDSYYNNMFVSCKQSEKNEKQHITPRMIDIFISINYLFKYYNQ